MRGKVKVWLFAVVPCLLFSSVAVAADYKTYQAAIAAAQPLLRSRDYEAALEPLEAARDLAKDDRQRTQAYEALRQCYRQLPTIDGMVEAYEFLVEHADTKAGRSVTASDFAGFLRQRGQFAAAIERYEERLKTNENDVAALSVLPLIYKQSKTTDAPRGVELEKKLEALNIALATKRAETLLKTALGDPKSAAHTYKDAAMAWLEAGEKEKARAAAELSLKSPPESRSSILTMFWREHLGDVFVEIGDPAVAAQQYEQALESAPEGIKKRITEKLEKARAPGK
jgi:tetratricopeptide (TPR) repeat protein